MPGLDFIRVPVTVTKHTNADTAAVVMKWIAGCPHQTIFFLIAVEHRSWDCWFAWQATKQRYEGLG